MAAMEVNAARMAELLTTRRLARNLVVEEVLESTNQTVVDLAAQGAPDGLVVVADHQTGGRGRNGRQWFSPIGRNLYFTMLFRPDCRPGIAPQLAIVAAMSLYRTLKTLCPEAPVAVKWPNDIWVDGHKMCGILCGMSCMGMKTEYVYAGIGINVNMLAEDAPEALRDTVMSLRMFSGRMWDRAEVLARFCNVFEADFEEWLSAGNLSPFMARWKEASLLDGREVQVEQGKLLLKGQADGITTEGFLRLRDASGRVEYASAGDAHVVFQSK